MCNNNLNLSYYNKNIKREITLMWLKLDKIFIKINSRKYIRFLSINGVLMFLFIFLSIFFLLLEVSADSSPSIYFQEESWDFGDIAPDELPTHIFEFKNYGDEELIIKDIKVDCESCADALPSAKNIMPGEAGEIKVTINSLDMKGRFSKRVYIFTNDPAHPRVTLNLSGFIREKDSLYLDNQTSEQLTTYDSSPSPADIFPVYMAYFYEPGCHDCDKAKAIWISVNQKYPNLVIKSFDISLAENVKLAEAMGELYNMPEEERLLVPVIFIGDIYLLREAITYASLEDLIQKNSTIESIPPWEMVKEEEIEIKERLITRFQSFGFAAVAVSGLIDGINPCAFATIIFFISYLTLINRKGKDILWVGGMFAFVVFLTYFLIGTGALKVVTTLSFLPFARKLFSLATAGIALVLGFISLSDYIQFKKKGTSKDAKLRLSPFLKKMIHSTIRKNVRLNNYILMAAVTGFIVSLLELACTGQIYLPTLMFISTIPNLKINAIFYLLLYNLMFIVPLVLVFTFTYWGTSSAQWSALTQKNFGKIKMAMTLLFFGLAILLLYTGIFY